jgi:hypothetical protein
VIQLKADFVKAGLAQNHLSAGRPTAVASQTLVTGGLFPLKTDFFVDIEVHVG